MRFDVFSIRDSAVGAFNTPFFVRSRGEAMRMFVNTVQDDKSSIARNAPDYTLYLIGFWDDSSAAFELMESPEKVLTATDALNIT